MSDDQLGSMLTSDLIGAFKGTIAVSRQVQCRYYLLHVATTPIAFVSMPRQEWSLHTSTVAVDPCETCNQNRQQTEWMPQTSV